MVDVFDVDKGSESFYSDVVKIHEFEASLGHRFAFWTKLNIEFYRDPADAIFKALED